MGLTTLRRKPPARAFLENTLRMGAYRNSVRAPGNLRHRLEESSSIDGGEPRGNPGAVETHIPVILLQADEPARTLLSLVALPEFLREKRAVLKELSPE